MLGIPVRCSLMYGNPGETKTSLLNTIELIRKTKPDEWNLAVLKPTPGSEFWKDPKGCGLYFDKQAIIDSDYEMLNRFEDNGIGHVIAGLDTMTKEDLERELPWFVKELERACPRKTIQDTIQDIKV
jgi:coproporphyrinogen III oxidase-like Fe-S oxidoreductase